MSARAIEKKRLAEKLYRQVKQQIEMTIQECEKCDKYMNILREIWKGSGGKEALLLRSSISETYLKVWMGKGVEIEASGGMRYELEALEKGFDDIMAVLRQLRAEFDLEVKVVTVS